jgi:hypothetical protein
MAEAAKKNALVNPYIEKANALNEKAAKLREAQPLPGIEALAAYRRAQADEDRENAELRSTEGSRALRAFTRGLERRDSSSVDSQMAAFTNERALARKSMETRAGLASAIVDLQNAKAAGDTEKAAAATKEIAGLMSLQQKMQSDMATHGMSMAGTITSSQVHAKAQIEAEKLRNASQEKLEKMRLKHAEVMKTLPDYERSQINSYVNEIAGKGADATARLAATETVIRQLHPDKFIGEQKVDQASRKAIETAMEKWSAANPELLAKNDPTYYTRKEMEERAAYRRAGIRYDGAAAPTALPPGFEREKK